jgi:hypothetical protein
MRLLLRRYIDGDGEITVLDVDHILHGGNAGRRNLALDGGEGMDFRFKISDLRLGQGGAAIACGGTAEEKTGNVKLRANKGVKGEFRVI